MKFVVALTTLLAGSAAAFAPAPAAFGKSHNGIATVRFRIVAHVFIRLELAYLTPTRLLSPIRY
jgi:hypothetical protein